MLSLWTSLTALSLTENSKVQVFSSPFQEQYKFADAHAAQEVYLSPESYGKARIFLLVDLQEKIFQTLSWGDKKNK